MYMCKPHLKFPWLFVWEAEQKKEIQNGCYLKTTCQNNPKSNQHVESAYVHIYTKYKVSMIKYAGRRAN